MRKVRGFKCTGGDHRAWCTECDWKASAKQRPRGGSRAAEGARRHTLKTGHETRVDRSEQRGYETWESCDKRLAEREARGKKGDGD